MLQGSGAGRGSFAKSEDFSPCRLQASLTCSTAQMRTPILGLRPRGGFESTPAGDKKERPSQRKGLASSMKMGAGRGAFACGKKVSLRSVEASFPTGSAQLRTPISANGTEGGSPPLCYTNKNTPRHMDGVHFYWRRQRDSNPRGFWPNGFQDF